MSIKDKLPCSYLEFIERYEEPFKIVDTSKGTRYVIHQKVHQKVPGTRLVGTRYEWLIDFLKKKILKGDFE